MKNGVVGSWWSLTVVGLFHKHLEPESQPFMDKCLFQLDDEPNLYEWEMVVSPNIHPSIKTWVVWRTSRQNVLWVDSQKSYESNRFLFRENFYPKMEMLQGFARSLGMLVLWRLKIVPWGFSDCRGNSLLDTTAGCIAGKTAASRGDTEVKKIAASQSLLGCPGTGS